MTILNKVYLVLCICLSALFVSHCGDGAINSEFSASSYVSYHDPADITAVYTINDGFLPTVRNAAVIVSFSKDGQRLKYDDGTQIYANGTELPFRSEGYMRYSAFIPLDENATEIVITTVHATGSIEQETITLAQRVQLNNYSHNDAAPDLLNGSLDLSYSPSINTDSNINVGGGECSNHYDVTSQQLGNVTFDSSHLNQDDINNYVSGEKVHFRVRHQEIYGPPAGFTQGRIESNAFTTFDLIIP